MADSVNNVTTDWKSVLSTAQAGLTSTQNQIARIEAEAAPLRRQMDDAKAALDAQQSFYQAAIEKFRPRPAYEEILPLKDAYDKDPTNPAKKAAWEKALATFNSQVAILKEETRGFEGIINGLRQSYSSAQSRYNAVWQQLPPLYKEEANYKAQIDKANASLNSQATGTTPANTTTVSATTVPASNKPGDPSIATSGDPSINKLLTDGDKPLVDEAGNPTSSSDPSINALLRDGNKPLVDVDQVITEAQNLKVDLPDFDTEPGYAEIYAAESQATEQDQANFQAKADWRVRLSLAPDSQYLYNDPEYAGILKPLKETDGVIFPYTPSITVNYAANYEATNIVHSNYKIYQYSGSAVEQVTIACDFTCQDTYEANYLLSVIHFFRSMTKMFYGQDTLPKNGTPPPLCYMFGMGGYQFAAHPLAISGFSYNLPADVDYIKTTSASPAGSPVPAAATNDVSATRLSGTNVGKGGTGPGPKFNTGIGNETVTWVPTKIQLSITCLPIMSRNAISNQFSLRQYGSGDLVLGTRKPGGGMW